jgi:hypothetical protein
MKRVESSGREWEGGRRMNSTALNGRLPQGACFIVSRANIIIEPRFPSF